MTKIKLSLSRYENVEDAMDALDRSDLLYSDESEWDGMILSCIDNIYYNNLPKDVKILVHDEYKSYEKIMRRFLHAEQSMTYEELLNDLLKVTVFSEVNLGNLTAFESGYETCFPKDFINNDQIKYFNHIFDYTYVLHSTFEILEKCQLNPEWLIRSF